MAGSIRKNTNSHKILKCLAISAGVLIISTIAPVSGAKLAKELIKGYFRRKAFEKQRFLNDLKNLQKRSLINYRELSDGKVEITLTKTGKAKVLSYDLDNIQLNKSKGWDGEWRLIMFDIPHYHKKARDAFRRKLKDLKFYPLQKSVFITPYPCENEIDFLTSIFNVRQNVLLLYVSHFEGEEKLKNHFQI